MWEHFDFFLHLSKDFRNEDKYILQFQGYTARKLHELLHSAIFPILNYQKLIDLKENEIKDFRPYFKV